MSIKPFSEVVTSTPVNAEKVRPFVDAAQGGVEIDEHIIIAEAAKTQENIVAKTVSFLGSFQGLVSVLTLFMILALFIDAAQTIEDLYVSSSLLDMLYLGGLALLLGALGTYIYMNYRQIRMLKSAQKHQDAFAQEKESPSKKIVPMTLALLSQYDLTENTPLKKRSEILRERISSSHDYKAIYRELDEEVLEIVDTVVESRIKSASMQAALSTAISPLAILDAGIVIWRGVRLTKEIARLYGFKPGWISTIVLLKKGAFSVLFAGAAELAVEYVNAAGESGVVSKISLSAGQGISNGVLLARLGYGVMSACRPLPMRVKRQSFVTSVVSLIKDTILQSKK